MLQNAGLMSKSSDFGKAASSKDILRLAARGAGHYKFEGVPSSEFDDIEPSA